MEQIFEAYKASGALHHAYLIEGDACAAKSALLALFAAHDLPHEGHPDFWMGEFESFGVDESRALKALQAGRAVAGERRVLVVFTTLITHEAQNALLKVFEEPTPGTYLFLVVPSAHALLPTLRSRMMQVARGGMDMAPRYDDEAREFLGAPLVTRLAIAKKIADRVTDKKERSYAIGVADAILDIVHGRFLNGDKDAQGVRALRSVERARWYLSDRSPSVKMLFEYLALMLP